MLKKYLFFLFSITAVAFASLLIVINNYNPYSSGHILYGLLFTSFFITCAGILTLLIFYSKIFIFKNSLMFVIFKPSLRQGIIISLGITSLMILQSMRLLDAWVGIPLLIVIVLIELFFQTKKN